MPRFSIITLGCKVNQYDSNSVADLLVRQGWELSQPDEPSDLMVVNTCCITRTAMRKSRQALAKAHRRWPEAALVIIGCYSDYDGRRISEMLARMGVRPGQALIAGHHQDLPALIDNFVTLVSGQISADPSSTRPGSVGSEPARRTDFFSDCSAMPDPQSVKARRLQAIKQPATTGNTLRHIDKFLGRQRAFVKVQDGCDAFCTYCIVPYTRCRVWSKSIEEVVSECRTLVAAGHLEIVLSGVFLGAFGRQSTVRRRWPEDSPAQLPELVARVAEIEGLWRIRLSSLEPGDMTDELLDVCRNVGNVAPHFHLPLQSGSAKVLARMNRQYGPRQYKDAISRLKAAIDRPAITTDIIVGFPGAENRDFAETLAMAQWAGFAKIHAFAFSPIEPAQAFYWQSQCPPAEVVKERMALLGKLESELASKFRRQFVGQTVEALVERQSADADKHLAMTDRYFRVAFSPGPATKDDLTGKIVKLRIDRATGSLVEGTIAATAAT